MEWRVRARSRTEGAVMEKGHTECPACGWDRVAWEMDGGDMSVSACPQCGSEFKVLGIDWRVETVHLSAIKARGEA